MAALRVFQGQGQTFQRICVEAPKVCSSHTIQKRHKTNNIAAYKRGRGGRSSFSGIVCTVLGSSGFLGRYVVNKLGKIGSQVICPYRGEPYYMKDLRLAGDLGQILFLPYNLRDEDSLRKVMQYSNVVVNLVGRDWETRNFSFQDVHMDGAQRIARIAKECGVQKLIHFSALNASPEPERIYIKNGSKFLRTKFYGEEMVREEFPEAVIMKPADMYGPEDRFLRYYMNGWRRSLGTVPLWKKGTQTVKMPVFVGDVAQGVMNAILDPDTDGKDYELVGPQAFYLSDLIDYFYRVIRDDRTRRGYVNPLFRAKMAYMSYAPSYPLLSMEKFEREFISDGLSDKPLTLVDLGVGNLVKVEDRAPYELKPFKKHSYYEEAVGEFADPEPPPFISDVHCGCEKFEAA